MFTGIIERVGVVAALERDGEKTRLCVEAPGVGEGVHVGDSVAVAGVCLTATTVAPDRLDFDAVSETLDRSALGDLAVGGRVNLERALRASDRLDGHIVQGHVDGTGRVRVLERHGDDVRLHVDCDAELAALLVDKGSVAVDGVSLTVVDPGDDGFQVALIPHTLEVTTLGGLEPGDRVNLEADVLGKYVKKYLERVHRTASA